MKYALTALVLVLILGLTPIATEASSFGVSPVIVNLTIPANEYVDVDFVITGYEGTVNFGLEDLPSFSILPAEVVVTNGKAHTCIYSNTSPIGNYTGKVLVSSTGEEVNLGIKVKAYVSVIPSNSISLTTTLLRSSSNWHSWGSGGGTTTPSQTTTPTPDDTTTPSVIPPDIVPPTPSDSEPEPWIPGQVQPKQSVPWYSLINWYLVMVALIVLLVGVVGYVGWYEWRRRKLSR